MKYKIYKDDIWAYNEKIIAQRQLQGRTHYVDDATLRYHHSRIVACNPAKEGLAFWLIETMALDMHNTRRGYQYVVFDIFGNVVSRVNPEDSFKSRKASKAALDIFLTSFDAVRHTKEQIKREAKYDKESVSELKILLKKA